MKEARGPKNILNREDGQITLDFIFALTIGFGFSILFFAISFTLSMVEVCQYVTFAAARTYYAANVSEQAQKDLGEKKFNELKGKGFIKNILKTGWVTLGDVQLGNFNDDYSDSEAGPDAIFVGARVPFQANVLNLRLPLLGATVTDTQTGKATLNAYLLREVSTDECRSNFTSQRVSNLKQVDSRYQNFGNDGYLITDNGC
jgi:hypothetical protein